MIRWFDHTADLGMEISGDDAVALFTNAATGLFASIVSVERARLRDRHQNEIVVQGVDWEDLMVNWLRELLYLWNGKQQILSQLTIHSLSENNLNAVVTTDDFDPAGHSIDKEIKAVTYHQIQVKSDESGWRARVVFDV